MTNRFKNNVLEKRIPMWETNVIEDSIEGFQYKDIEKSSNVSQILINLGLLTRRILFYVFYYILILTITLLLACLIIFQVQKLKKS